MKKTVLVLATALCLTMGATTSYAKTSTEVTPKGQMVKSAPDTKKTKKSLKVEALPPQKKVKKASNKNAIKVNLTNGNTKNEDRKNTTNDVKAQWTEVESFILDYVNSSYVRRGEKGVSANNCLKRYSESLAQQVVNSIDNNGKPTHLNINDSQKQLTKCGYNKKFTVVQFASIGTHDKAMMDNNWLNKTRSDNGEVGMTKVQRDGWTVWVVLRGIE